MQGRMKEFGIERNECGEVLKRAMVGHISTINEDGYPYTVSVHFIWDGESVYFHGLNKGKKLDNIRRCSKVCFEVSDMKKILKEGVSIPCDADTAYESVVILGDACILEKAEDKKKILEGFVDKYLPELRRYDFPENIVNGTAVVKVMVREMTGKRHE